MVRHHHLQNEIDFVENGYCKCSIEPQEQRCSGFVRGTPYTVIRKRTIKREGFIFMKNVFSKMFLKCCKDHKKLQHYIAMLNIS